MLGVSARSMSRRVMLPHGRQMVAAFGDVLTRSFASVRSKAPSSDPLHLLQHECVSRQLCDPEGNRLPGVDWRISIAVTDAQRPKSVSPYWFALQFGCITVDNCHAAALHAPDSYLVLFLVCVCAYVDSGSELANGGN